jgi:NAD(P)-dependent dehydrogenase (short-subunit alcohol dehydrogenase family)
MGDRLKEKVVLVSGAGSSGPGWGNGKATAALFAREGAKVRPKHVWSIRTKLQIAGRTRDLAMFNLAIDSKLR